jgi:hypothetical protein
LIDGARTQEQLDGLSVADAKDLNETIRLASKSPTACFESVEVRLVNELNPPEAGHAA